MGRVYRATDTRLGRDVAIKVMAESISIDESKVKRFEQEARLAGSLNHPNIVVVFDVGIHEGAPYIVTEFLHGETLRERLAKGPLPLATAIDWALQMAHGLAAAHAKGIVHRDIKPENVFVTRNELVKLLDFGIAKLSEGSPGPATHRLLESTATPLGGVTATGEVVGTPTYMSPEQVRAEPLDARTDLFSFGAVFFEMLAGHRAFRGGTRVEVEYAVIRAEPEALPASIPTAVGLLVRHCLEKDRENRFQSARDLAFQLDVLRTTISSNRPTYVRTGSRRWWWVALGVATAGVAAVAVRSGAYSRLEPAPSLRQLTFRRGVVLSARFGPDARNLYFSASWNGEPESIYATTTNNPDYHPLGITDARALAVSRSGELAVLLRPRPTESRQSTGTLARVPGVGGVPRDLVDGVTSADWAADSANLAISRETVGQVSRVEYPIGTTLYESQSRLTDVRISPRGWIAFAVHPVWEDSSGDIIVIEPGKPTHVLARNLASITGIAWATNGKELWFSGYPSALDGEGLWSVSQGGDVHLVYPELSEFFLDDISSNGRVLAREMNVQADIAVRNVVRNTINAHLGWFDLPLLGAISDDGLSLLLVEGNVAGTYFGGGGRWTFFQKTDGSPPVRLGEGVPLAISPDGKWVLAADFHDQNRVWLLPTGTGRSSSLDLPGLNSGLWLNGQFLPDSNRAVVPMKVTDGIRVHLIDFATRNSRALTPPLKRPGPASPDGRFVSGEALDGQWTAYPTEVGSPRALQGIGRDESVLAWTKRGLLVSAAASLQAPLPIFRVLPETGVRDLFITLAAESPGATILSVRVTPDEQTVAYSYLTKTSKLFFIDFRPQ
jgi:eukaryotic-like serine/threonine-protein kinase